MEANKEQLKHAFEKNKQHVEKHYLFKLISTILAIVVVVGILFLPIFDGGASMNELNTKYEWDLSKDEQKEIIAMFKEHEDTVKQDPYYDLAQDSLDENFMFSDAYGYFWDDIKDYIAECLEEDKKMELIRDGLTSEQRQELIESYRSGSDSGIISTTTFILKDYDFAEGAGNLADGVVIFVYLSKLFFFACCAFAITLIVFAIKDILIYTQRDDETKFSYFLNKYEHRDDKKRVWKGKVVERSLYALALCIVMPIALIWKYEEIKISFAWTIALLAIGAVAYIIMNVLATNELNNAFDKVVLEQYNEEKESK